MKIATVYDDNGRILMAIVDDGKYDSPRPVPDRRTHGGTFEVPSALEKTSLEEICTTDRPQHQSAYEKQGLRLSRKRSSG